MMKSLIALFFVAGLAHANPKASQTAKPATTPPPAATQEAAEMAPPADHATDTATTAKTAPTTKTAIAYKSDAEAKAACLKEQPKLQGLALSKCVKEKMTKL